MEALTRHQQKVLAALQAFAEAGRAPSLEELAAELGLRSRGSLHKHVRALEQGGYVLPAEGRHRGIRLTDQGQTTGAAAGSAAASGGPAADTLPLLGRIAAGRPLEAVPDPVPVEVPYALRGRGECYVLEVRGDSLQDAGILDGDWVVIESRSHARNGDIVVALIEGGEATLKRIEQTPDGVWLHAENAAYSPIFVHADCLEIQGVLVGQMRRYTASGNGLPR